MYKKEEKQLMRRKVNVTQPLIELWKKYFLDDIKHPIHSSLMEINDIGKTFNHQDRVFEIIGMTISKTIMLRETRDEGVFFWECTRNFVQMKLERFNEEYYQAPLKKRMSTRPIPYSNNSMYLPPLNKRIKTEEVKKENEEITEIEVEYQEDSYEEETNIEE